MKLPAVIKPNGDINLEWVDVYMAIHNCDNKTAKEAHQVAILEMDEPDLQTSSGKLSKKWVTWFRARKRISTNVSIRIGNERIQALKENTGKVKDVLPHFVVEISEDLSYERGQLL